MSLLVWLPLNGDLRNNGLAGDITVTNSGATVNAAGKIGKCYQFGTVASGISLSVDDLQSCSEVSVAFWIKIISWNTAWATFFQAGKNSHAWTDYIFGFLRNSSSPQIAFVIGNGSSTTTTHCSTGDLELNRWYYIVGTYSSGKLHLYVDGDQVSEYSTALQLNSSVITKATLGRANSTVYQSNCLMNDFRIYDHALSDREVKELSKGLVAHWKLDDPYVEETTNLVTSSTTGSGQITRVDDTLVTSGENKDTYFRLSLGAALVAGTTYTVSMYCRGMADGGTATFGVGAQSGDNRAALWTVQNGHNECTFIVPTGLNGATSIIFDDTNRVGLLDHQAVFSQIQVERKDHATGYIAWGTSRAKGAVYDSSGYGHDGTLSPTPPTFDSDSARYSGCMKFSSNYIHCGLSSLYPTDEITVAWWGYMDSWGSSRPISCTEAGGWNFEQGDGGGWRFPVYKNGIGYVYSVPAKKWADYTSGWHFFVGTFDGYVSRIYVDGELDSTSTNGSPTVKATIMYRANVPIYIGCEANGANPYTPYFNGKLSDIRIYATALSADDIKELYNTSASIDNHHNVYAREFVED